MGFPKITHFDYQYKKINDWCENKKERSISNVDDYILFVLT